MFKRDFTIRIAIALIAAIVIVYFYPHRQTSRYNYEEGRPWSYAKLIAPFDIPIHPDSLTLRKAKDTLDARFVPVYELNQLVIDTIIKSLPKSPGSDYQSRLALRLRRIYAAGVVDADTKAQIVSGKLPKVRILEKNILSEMSTADFTSLSEVYQELDSTITDAGMHKYFASASLQNLLRPNIVYNEAESNRHYEYDYLTLTADRGVIQQGQTIVDKGTIITPQDYTNLKTYEQMIESQITKETKSNLLMILGQFLYVAMLLAALWLYIFSYAPKMYEDRSQLIFIFLLVTLFFLFASWLNTFIPTTGVYIVPLTIVPVLLLVFFDSRTALFASFILTLICAPITTFPLEFIFLQFSAASAAVYSLKELSRRSQLLRTAGFVAGAYIVSYVSLELLLNGTFEGMAWSMFVVLIVNSLLVSMTYILMFIVERVFGFTSVVTLVELADINNPLLRQLSNDCAGTFQHSIAVSNLVADAALRIGANEQLVRTGALYHDIGKLSNPAFFTENQHGVNPHDALPPEKSAEIVIRHVTDGLRRADKAGLPHVIKDFIREHHGAGKAKYFYFNYCKQHPESEIDPAPFSYPGPNPHSRETSLLMMADAVEAASRSLSEYTNESITGLVNKIIDTQLVEGLHNESTLQYRDIRVIKEAFIKRLMTMYHSRIAYPNAPENAVTTPVSSQDVQ
jgi:hypothetical protein